MKKEYIKPVAEKEEYKAIDVLTASPTGSGIDTVNPTGPDQGDD